MIADGIDVEDICCLFLRYYAGIATTAVQPTAFYAVGGGMRRGSSHDAARLVCSHTLYDDSISAARICWRSYNLTTMYSTSSLSPASGRHLEIPAARSVYRLQAVDGCVLLVLGGVLAGG